MVLRARLLTLDVGSMLPTERFVPPTVTEQHTIVFPTDFVFSSLTHLSFAVSYGHDFAKDDEWISLHFFEPLLTHATPQLQLMQPELPGAPVLWGEEDRPDVYEQLLRGIYHTASALVSATAAKCRIVCGSDYERESVHFAVSTKIDSDAAAAAAAAAAPAAAAAVAQQRVVVTKYPVTMPAFDD